MHHKEKFEEICFLITNLNADKDSDSIRLSYKLRKINEKFRKAVTTENSLSEIFEMLNNRALNEGEDFIHSFVLFCCNKQMQDFQVNGKILRHAILTVLQRNFQNSQKMKNESLDKFYNSIILLGVLFNQMRLPGSGQTINIIGQSLLSLINIELEKELRTLRHFQSNDLFAKTILSQIALNGSLLRNRHKTDIEQVLFNMRRVLIEIPTLSSKTKAYFLMTIDLFYSNLGSGSALEKMYQKFLMEDFKVSLDSKDEKKPTKPAEENIRKNLKLQIKVPDQRELNSPSSMSSKTPPRSPKKKTSPNGLKTIKSPTRRTSSVSVDSSKRNEDKLRNETNKTYINKEPSMLEQTANVENNPLRQQNSRSFNNRQTYKPIYFREENVENLTWNGDSDNEAEDSSKSPKAGYSTSDFLNFLSTN